MTGNTVVETIRVRGARTHNLRNVDVDIPLGKLIVVSGVSGSGKSSLAFDTIFAEGQRRYLESVSVHTRTLLKLLPRPDVDEVSSLPPTVSVDQRVTTAPGRSTLAVTTEIYDYLRLLFARAGTAHCTGCGKPVESQSVDQVVARILQRPERTKLMILSPMVRARKGAHKDIFERISRNGFVRARVNGELLDIADVPNLSVNKTHHIDAVIDRIIVKDGIRQRLRESIELAVRESDGTCIVCEEVDGSWADQLFSTRFHCADCDLSFTAPEPRTFSFNSVWGACPECEGFGIKGLAEEIDDITVFRKTPCDSCHGSRLQPFARGITFLGNSITEFTQLSVYDALQQVINWQKLFASSSGSESGLSSHVSDLSVEAVLVAKRTLPDILQRLECLDQVGVGYLTLDRATRTLSGGEFQRARLAACLGTGLHGACFVLDEPTAGLHPRDTQRLLQTLLAIRDSGATVIVVEHDGDIIRSADCLLDLGPGAGIEGGQLVFFGAPQKAAAISDGMTGRYLRGEFSHPSEWSDASQNVVSADGADTVGVRPFAIADAPRFTIRNARRNNLQNINVDVPLQRLVCITGVSGSGKSSLIMETLLPVVEKHCSGNLRKRKTVNDHSDIQFALADVECDAIDGLEHIRRVVAVDNGPLGRNRRSCIATYSKLWNDVRKIFAKTKHSRARGFDARRFSFNTGDGRCDGCKGTGLKDVRMTFLPDATVPCPDCHGQRFNKATLAVRFAGKNVADVLAMRIDEAAEFFKEMDSLHYLIETFRRVGLGYLTLGQPASTFSGGEAQRVKLATELASGRADATLFVLDEPTSGLHPADVVHLNQLLRQLVATGNSVIVIEHNIDVMLLSDWIIDIGPESAAGGGVVVAEGTPHEVAKNPRSLTGRYLKTGTFGLSR